ncbi:MAG: Alanine racemase [Candidatus Wolfebacteria bacterium GW2011_GWC1_37_10]|uniref:Alanine racemase n=1 Tax=Candidatus Wolfebacteria bacterium GW2011_GWC1_37_10 TaxID=1619010 RepID=A0A0G0G8H0_9BACT|nr:MAG: Alanine racemase [Candidatus Wolfebacteria bacterium GW2011_GWC1_37_10]
MKKSIKSAFHNLGLRTWIEINQRALKNNYKIFRNLIGRKRLLMAVVKSNAYGHGLIDFSRSVEKLGIDWFGVDSIVEAENLRKNGIKKPILVLGYTLLDKINEAVKNNISLTVADFATLKKIKIINNNKEIKIHLKGKEFILIFLRLRIRRFRPRQCVKLKNLKKQSIFWNQPDLKKS